MILFKMLWVFLLVHQCCSSFDCTKTNPVYKFSGIPSYCPSKHPTSSIPILFPPLSILESTNMSRANTTTSSGYLCDKDESDANCKYVIRVAYVEFGSIWGTYTFYSFSSGDHAVVNMRNWVMFNFENDFFSEHLQVIKSNSSSAFIVICDSSTCKYYHMNDMGNVTYVTQKTIVGGRNISSIDHIVDSSENVFLLFTLNNTANNEVDVVVQKVDLFVDNFDSVIFPTNGWHLPNSESQYRLSVTRQYLNFNKSNLNFFTEEVSTNYQDLVLIYNSSLLFVLQFNFTNLLQSDFSFALFYETRTSSHELTSVRGIPHTMLRLDHEKSNCSKYIHRDDHELLQLLVISSFPVLINGSVRMDSLIEVIDFPDFNILSKNHLNPTQLQNLNEVCDRMSFWNGSHCEARTSVDYVMENMEFHDFTKTRFYRHVTESVNDSDSTQLGLSNLCEFFITSQRIYSDVDKSLMEECLNLLNSTESACDVEEFQSNREIRKWVLYNSWHSQIFLTSTKDDFITMYFGVDVDEEKAYYRYPYLHKLHVLGNTKLRGRVKDVMVSKNGFHVFVAHERKKWELESIERRVEICSLLMNRTITRKIKENLSNDLMIDLIDEIRDLCQRYPPNSVSMNDFDLYYSNVRRGFYAPYFDKYYVKLPEPGIFSIFPLHMSGCLAGFYCRDGKANICPTGHFCPAAAKQPRICSSVNSGFKTCPRGQISDLGLPCPVGHVCPSHIFQPIPVPPGFQQNLTSFRAYLEYYEDMKAELNLTSLDINSTLSKLNNTLNGSSSAFGNLSVSANTFFPCDLGEWCPLYIFFDNLCPAGTECSEPSRLLPALCNYTLPTMDNLYGRTQYCPNGTYDASLCQSGHRCEGPLHIARCDTHFHCPEGTMFQNICPGRYYCPTPSEKYLCPWHHFCSSGSVKPKRCSWLSICPPGMEYDRYNFVGIIGIGGVALLVFLGLQCIKRVSSKWKKRKRKKEAKSNWKEFKKEFKKMDMSSIAAAFGISESCNDGVDPKEEIFETKNMPIPTIEDGYTEEEIREFEEDLTPVPVPQEEKPKDFCSQSDSERDHDLFQNKVTEEEEEDDDYGLEIIKLRNERWTCREICCFPCDVFYYFLCCRYCRKRRKRRSPFFVDLGFDKLSLTVKSNGKKVLNEVTGEIPHGGVCAVMGLSGCGKSSFITALAGRAHYGFTDGKIYINKIEQNLRSLEKFVGFVPQEDVMMRTLSVEENITFSARTRLDSSTSAREIRRKVDRVIELLGLDFIRNSPIGDENIRGISGGQRKRVNIALELVADPLVLFLDEPTSGLDSSSSQQVCDALKAIAKEGINVITVIHQPRFEIFEQFDNLLLLGVGGEIVFLGSVPEMMPYFDSLGFSLTKAGVNPIDHVLDCVDGRIVCADGPDGPDGNQGRAWEQEEFFTQWKKRRDLSYLSHKPSGSEQRKIQKRIKKETNSRNRPTCRQFQMSFKRALVMKLRAWKTFVTDKILILVGGIFLGTLFMGEEYIGSLPKSLSDQCPSFIRIKCDIPVMDPLLKHSALIGLIMSLGGVMSSLNTFGTGRAIFLREKSSGLSTFAEFVSRSTVDLINIIVSPWIFLGVYYTIKAPRGLLMYYVLILTGLHYASYGFGYFISVLFQPSVSKIAGVVILLISFLFSGLNVTVRGMSLWPFPINLIPWVCFLRYSTEALYLIEITRLKEFHNVDFGMMLYGYDFKNLWWCILCLYLVGMVYRVVAYFLWLQSVPTSTMNSIKSKLMYFKYRMKRRCKGCRSCCLDVFCGFCCPICARSRRKKKKKMKMKMKKKNRKEIDCKDQPFSLVVVDDDKKNENIIHRDDNDEQEEEEELESMSDGDDDDDEEGEEMVEVSVFQPNVEGSEEEEEEGEGEVSIYSPSSVPVEGWEMEDI